MHLFSDLYLINNYNYIVILGKAEGCTALCVACAMLVNTVCAICYDSVTLIIMFYFAQDFEALTPNLLARTVETVEGGGLVVLLLRTVSSLKQLYTMAMVCVFCSL